MHGSKCPLLHQGNLLRFFGYNNDNGICLLRESDGCPMPGAKTLVEIWILRKGQDTASGLDLSLIDNHPAVMKW